MCIFVRKSNFHNIYEITKLIEVTFLEVTFIEIIPQDYSCRLPDLIGYGREYGLSGWEFGCENDEFCSVSAHWITQVNQAG